MKAKARTIFDTIGVIAAGAAIAQQAIDVLGPHISQANVGALLPRAITNLPRRIGAGVSAFLADPDAAQRKANKPAPRVRHVPIAPGVPATNGAHHAPRVRRSPHASPQRVHA